ncbi:MAG: hypothetical protein ACQETO_10370 [Pseudomonadota bacterium]
MSDQRSEPAHGADRNAGETEPTLDGRRLRINELNMPEVPSRPTWWQRVRRNLSLFIAGLYTGESCAGTPHRDRKSRVRNSNRL